MSLEEALANLGGAILVLFFGILFLVLSTFKIEGFDIEEDYKTLKFYLSRFWEKFVKVFIKIYDFISGGK